MENKTVDKKLSLFAETNILFESSVLANVQLLIDESEWTWTERNLHNYVMDRNTLYQSRIESDLKNFIEDFDCEIVIFKVPAYTHIPWHVDVNPNRKCFVNLPLSDYTLSETFYLDTHELDYEDSHGSLTVRVPYLLGIPYLMNGLKYHNVFNWGNKPRYLISLTSGLLEYASAFEYLSSKNLINRCW